MKYMKLISALFFMFLGMSIYAQELEIELMDGSIKTTKDIAEQSATIKNWLDDMETMGEQFDSIPLPIISLQEWNLAEPLLKIKSMIPEPAAAAAIKALLKTYKKDNLITTLNAINYLDCAVILDHIIQVLADMSKQKVPGNELKAIEEICSLERIGLDPKLLEGKTDQEIEQMEKENEERNKNKLPAELTSKLYFNILQIASGYILSSVLTGRSDVRALTLSIDNTILYSASVDAHIKIWNLADPNKPVLIETLDESHGGHTKPINTLAVSPDGSTLYSGSDDATIRVWNISDHQNPSFLKTLSQKLNNGHTGAITDLVVSPDGKTLYSASRDATINVWDVSNPRKPVLLKVLNQAVRGHNGAVNALALSHDGKTLYSASDDKTIKVWNVTVPRNTALLKTVISSRVLKAHSDKVNTLALSHDSKTLYSGSEDATIKVWNVSKPNNPILRKTLTKNDGGHISAIKVLTLSSESKALYSGSKRGSVRIWDVTNPAKPRKIQTLDIAKKGKDDDLINALVALQNGKTLYSGSNDNTIKVWENILKKDLRYLSCDDAKAIVKLRQDQKKYMNKK